MALSYQEWKAQKATGKVPPISPKPENLTEVNGVLGGLGSFAGVKHLGELAGSVGLFRSKEKKQLDQSMSGLDAINKKLIEHALSLPPGPRRTELLRQAQQNAQLSSAQQGSIAMSAPTGKQVASDIGQLALTAIGSKIPTGQGLLRSQELGGEVVKGLGKQILLSKVPQATALGAGYGADIAFGQNKNAKDIGKAALVSGLTSGGVTGGLGLLGKLIGALSRESARAGYKIATGLPNKANADILLESGVTGGREKLKNKAYDLMNEAIKAKEGLPEYATTQDISDIAKSPEVQGMFDRAKLAGGTEQLNKTLQEISGLPTAQGQFGQTVIKNKQVTNEFLDKLKQALDSDTSNAVLSGGRTTSQDVGLRNAISDQIRGMLPEAITSQNAKEQAALQLIDAIKKYGNKPSSLGMSWNAILQRTAFRPGITTPLAKLGYNLGRAGESQVGQILSRVLRQVIARGSGEIQ